MSKEHSDKPNLFNSPRLGCALIVIFVVLVVLAIWIPVYIDHEDRDYCVKAETDAYEIVAKITDYFSIPAHTRISTADIDYTPSGNNTFTITATDPSIMITITVTDGSGRCSERWQETLSGWDGNGVYTKIMSNN